MSDGRSRVRPRQQKFRSQLLIRAIVDDDNKYTVQITCELKSHLHRRLRHVTYNIVVCHTMNLSADLFRTSTGSHKPNSLEACWTRIPITTHYTRPRSQQICSQFNRSYHTIVHTRNRWVSAYHSQHLQCTSFIELPTEQTSTHLTAGLQLPHDCSQPRTSRSAAGFVDTIGINVDVKNYRVSTDALNEQQLCGLEISTACVVRAQTNDPCAHPSHPSNSCQ